MPEALKYRKDPEKFKARYREYWRKNGHRYLERKRETQRKSTQAARVRLATGTGTEVDDRNWAADKIRRIKRRAECSLTPEYLLKLWRRQKGRCALSGLELKRMVENDPLSASIDKIRHNLGYVKGNVRFLAMCVNAFRGRMNDAKMKTVARAILDN